ncbi:transmembrane protein, partial [Trifolium pratense]
MFIAKSTKGLLSIIVIIILILPQIAAQAVSPADSPADNVSEQIIQKDNTIRVDPLDNFKKYRGGFNITNKNYWSSVIFTGVYGYAIGIFFLLCGIV